MAGYLNLRPQLSRTVVAILLTLLLSLMLNGCSTTKTNLKSDVDVNLNDPKLMLLNANVILSEIKVNDNPTDIYQQAKPALDLLEKASKAGYAFATDKLTHIYYKGLHTPQDFDRSFRYSQLAYQQIDRVNLPHGFAQLRANLALGYCFGFDNSKDLDKCLHLLNHQQAKQEGIKIRSELYDPLNKMLIYIVFSNQGRLTPTQIEPFRNLLTKQIKVTPQPVEARATKCPISWGRISDTIEVENGKKISACFNVVKSSYVKTPEHRTRLFGRIYSTDKRGRFDVKNYHAMSNIQASHWTFIYTFDQEDLIDAHWRIEIHDILGNVVFERDFKTVYQE